MRVVSKLQMIHSATEQVNQASTYSGMVLEGVHLTKKNFQFFLLVNNQHYFLLIISSYHYH
jgi:hypothetical protein